MDGKQKQIEEMAKDLEQAKDWAMGTAGSLNSGFGGWYGTYMYNQGYRKQSDTAREVIIKFLSIIQNEYEYYPDGMTLGTYAQLRKEIKELAAQYGVAFDERAIGESIFLTEEAVKEKMKKLQEKDND